MYKAHFRLRLSTSASRRFERFILHKLGNFEDESNIFRQNVENHIASDADALLLSSYYLSFSFVTVLYPLLIFVFSFILNGCSPSVCGFKSSHYIRYSHAGFCGFPQLFQTRVELLSYFLSRNGY
jgi:hypothetical protein